MLNASFGCSLAAADKVPGATLRNITYPSDYAHSGRAPLTDGRYEEPAAPGSGVKVVVRLTDLLATGVIGGRDIAALVLVTDPGGSAVFFDLYVLERSEEGWSVVDHAPLGDRVRVHNVRIEQERIGLDMTLHGPADPVCCPSRPARVQYALKDGRLTKAEAPVATNSIAPIVGQVWTWQHTVHADGRRTTPGEPDHYTIHLGSGAQLAVRADCNRAGGTYRLEESRLTLSVTHSTMAACPPDSRDRQFLTDLSGVHAWSAESGQLRLDLRAGGTMTFTAVGP
jgi:heat shock protein HslJ